jgi:frataxin
LSTLTPSEAVEACKMLDFLLLRLEGLGFDGDCDGYSLTFHAQDGKSYLLNYHGVTRQIWLASPLTGAHHFRLQEGRWISTRSSDNLISLLETELAVSLS